VNALLAPALAALKLNALNLLSALLALLVLVPLALNRLLSARLKM
jgi:hypothetical protein